MIKAYRCIKKRERLLQIFFEQITHLYPQAMDVGFKIKDYIKQVHSIVIPNDELTDLAVHIHRLISYQQLK